MSMNQEQLMYVLLALAGGGLAGGILYAFGGSRGRPWALPAAAAIAFAGMDYVMEMPAWVLVSGFLLSLFLVQKSVKGSQEDAAREIAKFQIEKKGPALQRIHDPSGRYLSIWKMAEKDAPGAEPLAVGLHFAGEADEDLRVVVEARAEKFRPGVIVAHHAAAEGEAAGILKDVEPLKDLPGQPGDLCLRAAPVELGFAVLDSHILSVLREILDLRAKHREVWFHLNGPVLRFVSTGTFTTEELQRLLELGGAVFQQARLAGRQQ